MARNIEEILEKQKAIFLHARARSFTVFERAELAEKLAELMLTYATKVETKHEKREQEILHNLIKDPKAKYFAVQMTDICFRAVDPKEAIRQLHKLIKKWGRPKFLNFFEQIGFSTVIFIGKAFTNTANFLIQKLMRFVTRNVIIHGEEPSLNSFLRKKELLDIQVTVNRLGEAVLGEKETSKRLAQNIRDLENPLIEMIAIKISSIYSQINLLSWQETLDILSERLRLLFRTCKKNLYNDRYKFVHIDMEEYKDLALTVQLFQDVLDEVEFSDLSCGITLQSYLPESYFILKTLMHWAERRVLKGGAPIKIRITKGANLSMEKVDASMKGWPQAPFKDKVDVDANFKKMIDFSITPRYLECCRIGVASHNLFDIAYALLLAVECRQENKIYIEMLEGMATPFHKAVKALCNNFGVYCAVARKKDFHNAMAYLLRRLDENTAKDNFLSHLFNLRPKSVDWTAQYNAFYRSCIMMPSIQETPRRVQNRLLPIKKGHPASIFTNEQDTDFSLQENRIWASKIREKWQHQYREIPLVICGKQVFTNERKFGFDPSHPGKKIYSSSVASKHEVLETIFATTQYARSWFDVPLKKKISIFQEALHLFQVYRSELIGSMLLESSKIIQESDTEVTEAIDFINSAIFCLEEIEILGLKFDKPKTAAVISPWNFPCSIPVNGIISALATNHVVVFKPAPEAILTGYLLCEHFWNAGVPKEALQFIPCSDLDATDLVLDSRIDSVIFTGGTETARFFENTRPTIQLFGETGGKNAIIVTSLSDRDLAAKEIAYSAFGYSGQKCSACSLVVVLEDVLKKTNFLDQLVDAVESLNVGISWDPGTIINPLIADANPKLLRGLTTLEDGEKWLLEPKQDSENSKLWSPGIKIGTKPKSFTHMTELFGPVLSIMSAKNLSEAIDLVNMVPYGLTSGLFSLDPDEISLWKEKIEAGNCYINRSITGAIVGRQPFGGIKDSSFGLGMKAGGPNYLLQLGSFENSCEFQNDETHLIKEKIISFAKSFSPILDIWQIDMLDRALSSYAFWQATYFSKEHELAKIVGQDNTMIYVPKKSLYVQLLEKDTLSDVLMVIGAILIANIPCTIGFDQKLFDLFSPFLQEFSHLKIITRQELRQELKTKSSFRIRAISEPDSEFLEDIKAGCNGIIIREPHVLGRLELLIYFQEKVFSFNYHRYGNLLDRETELRDQIL